MNSSLIIQSIVFHFFDLYFGSNKKLSRNMVVKVMEFFYKGDRIIFENEDSIIIFDENILIIEMKNKNRKRVLNILRKVFQELKCREEIYEKIEIEYIKKNRISFIFPAP